MKRRAPDSSGHRSKDAPSNAKKKVTFQDGKGPSKHKKRNKEEEEAAGGTTALVKKKWMKVAKVGESSSSAHTMVDSKKRNELAKALDRKTLFEYLNSTEESAVELILAAFNYRIEQEHQLKLEHDARPAEEAELKEGMVLPPLDPLPDVFILQLYLEHSPEVHELWNILTWCSKQNKLRHTVGTLLFTCFSLVLRCNHWPHLQRTRHSICRTLTRSHMSLLQHELSADQPLHIVAILSIFTSIASASQFHARELFTAFNWSRTGFFELVRRKNATYEARENKSAQKKVQPENEKDKNEFGNVFLLDVRTHYIRFALAFLEHDDSTLIQDVLGVKGFLDGIFQALPADVAPLVLQVFETLHQHVLLNASVSKTTKAHFFWHKILDSIAAVYNRFTIDPEVFKRGAIARLTIRNLQTFLVSLLSSPSEGIMFVALPKPFSAAARLLPAIEELSAQGDYTSCSISTAQALSTVKNRNILSFINHLQPEKSVWQEKLVLLVLSRDSTMLRHYFQSAFVSSFEPAPTRDWVNTATFVMKLLDVRPFDLDHIVSAATSESFNFDKAVSWFVPSCCLNRTLISSGLQHPNRSVKFVTISLINSILTVLEDLTAAFKRELASSPNETSTLLHQILTGITGTFRRKLPDLQTVINLWRTTTNPSKTATPAPATPAKPNAEPEFSLDIDDDLFISQTMRLMATYIARFPTSFLELQFDVGKLLSVPEPWTAPLRVQTGLLQVIQAAITRLKWDNVITLPSDVKMTQLGYLLRFAIFTPEQSITDDMLACIKHLLQESGLFDRAHDEIDIWLNSLLVFRSETCVAYIDSAMAYLNVAPYYWLDGVTRQVQASDDAQLQELWRLPSYPASSLNFPFSPFMLCILKDHAHILVYALGGVEATQKQLAAPETVAKLVFLVEFLNTTLLHITLASELALPLLNTIATLATATTNTPSPERIVPIKRETLPDELMQNAQFASPFRNLRGFLYRVFGILPPEHHQPLGVAWSDLPVTSIWSYSRLNIHESLLEGGLFVGQMGDLDWLELGPIHLLCHVLSASHRSQLVQDEVLKMLLIRLMAQPRAILPSVQALLFFVGTFVTDEHSGDCLHFALHLLSTLFFQTLDSINSSSTAASVNATPMDITEADLATTIAPADQVEPIAPTPSSTASVNENQVLASKILRLILGNPCLNANFLHDLDSPSSLALSSIIAQLLEAVVVKSADFLVDDVRKLAADPLRKLTTVFSECLSDGKVSEKVVHCIPLVRTMSAFMTSDVVNQIMNVSIEIGARDLLYKDKEAELFELVLDLQMASASDTISVVTHSQPSFNLASPPPLIGHLIHTPLLSELSTPGARFQASMTSKKNMDGLLAILEYAATKPGKMSPHAHRLIPILDQAIFRLLLASQSVIYPDTNQAVNPIDVSLLALGAPSIPPDYGAGVTADLINALLKSCKKSLEGELEEPKETEEEPNLTNLHRAAICALYPSYFLAEASYYRKILSFMKKQSSFTNFSLLKQDVLDDLAKQSNAFLTGLSQAAVSHSHQWFVLILLNAHARHMTQDQVSVVAEAFKPFLNAVVASILHQGAKASALALSNPLLAFDSLSATTFDLLVNFGIPVLMKLLEYGPSVLFQPQELDDLCKTMSALASQKDVLLNRSQLLLIISVHQNQSRKDLVNCIVKQAATSLQKLATVLEPKPDAALVNTCSARAEFIISLLSRFVRDVMDMPHTDVLALIRRLLRFGYGCSGVLKFTLQVVSSLTGATAARVLTELHDLLVSHSSFIKVLFLQEEAELEALALTDKTKAFIFGAVKPLLQLLSLVYVCEPANSKKLTPSMLALYLSAYGATLSISDQLILDIIMSFEAHNISFADAGFLWGASAQQHKSSNRIVASSSIQANGSAMDVDDGDKTASAVPNIDLETFHNILFNTQLISHKIMMNTIRNFSPFLPLNTGSSFVDPEQLWPNKKSGVVSVDPASCYDVRFLLSIFIFGMQFFKPFDWKKFLEIGGLSVMLQTLSADDEKLRALAYRALATFADIIEADKTTHFKRTANIKMLLTVLQASIPTENLQLPGLIASFLAEAVFVLNHPEHALFMEVHNVFAFRPTLNLSTVPVFQRFMNSSRASAKQERDFALRLLSTGIRSSSDLLLLGMRVAVEHNTTSVQTSSGGNKHVFGLLISYLGSSLPSAFANTYERQRIWGILSKIIQNDAPRYKNTLLGPGGLLPLLGLWTSGHVYHAADHISVVPSAAAPSLTAYVDVATVLNTIVSLPEMATLAGDPQLSLQLQPVITNVLHFLQFSYTKFGSLITKQTALVAPTRKNSDDEDEDEDDKNAGKSSLETLADNPYWQLLSPCIILLYHFAIRLSDPTRSSTSMLKLAIQLTSILAGPFTPVCTHHPLRIPDALGNDDHVHTYSHPLTQLLRAEPKCSCAAADKENARHYLLLAHTIAHELPDTFDEAHTQDWIELADFALRIILVSSPRDPARLDSLCVLLSRLLSLSSTPSFGAFMRIMLREQNRSLQETLLFAYRQHTVDARSSPSELLLTVLLNSWCTAALGAELKLNPQYDLAADEKVQNWLPQKLSTLRTCVQQLPQKTIRRQLCESMSDEERTSHIELANFYRTLLTRSM